MKSVKSIKIKSYTTQIGVIGEIDPKKYFLKPSKSMQSVKSVETIEIKSYTTQIGVIGEFDIKKKSYTTLNRWNRLNQF